MVHSGPENLKKSRQKKSWNQIYQFFFSWNCTFGSFKLFPSSKIDLAIFEIEKMEFGQKIFREIDLFDFTSFSGLLWNQIYDIHMFFFLKEEHPQPRLHPRDPPVRNCQKSRWSTLTQRRKKPKKWKLQLVSQNLH